MQVSKFAPVLVALLAFSGCNSLQKANLFSVSEDINLGLQVSNEIQSSPDKYPLLPEQGNEAVYNYVRGIRDKILNTGRVSYRNQFKWDIKIIRDDKTLNAFCTPGGHIYVYTGLIKYLDSEDQLAGVLGHEIAHAALRHSTRQMTKALPMAILTGALSGGKQQLAQIASTLVTLSFSRDHEREADNYSVIYLCPTGYNASGAAGFFKKIEGKGGQPPQFLSTHPNPGNRVQSIEGKARQMGCAGASTNTSEYARIKNMLR